MPAIYRPLKKRGHAWSSFGTMALLLRRSRFEIDLGRTSLRLYDQVYNRRIADVHHFVPRDAITCETAACIEINLARAF